MKTLITPSTPEEAIKSRRTPCYGFTVVSDLETYPELHSLLTETRDNILKIVDPERETKKRPICSPLYIKQKFFHVSLFGMSPLLDQKEFFEHRNGLLHNDSINHMDATLRVHLEEQKPFLKPLTFEIKPDGSILARFEYKAASKENAPLLELNQKLDPGKKFARWDSGNPLRYTTVVSVLCVVDTDKMKDKINAIQEQLALSSEKLKVLSNFNLTALKLIQAYDKRTLSPKHIFDVTTIKSSNRFFENTNKISIVQNLEVEIKPEEQEKVDTLNLPDSSRHQNG